MANEQIDRIVSAQMGAPATPAAPAAPANPQQDQATAAALANGQPPAEQKTKQEQATETANPKAEDSKASEIAYEIETADGKKMKLTPQQITGVMERYQALNMATTEMAPIMALANAIRQKTGAKPEQIAGMFATALQKATQANPTMGDGDKNKAQPSDGDDPFRKWEEENHASLPPGYKDLTNNIGTIQQQQQQLMQMLAALASGTKQAIQANTEGMQQAQQQRAQMARQSIMHNLDNAQSKLGLPDDTANDFMAYASERGYTMGDFINPQLAFKVMSDFKNQMNTPEFQRLIEVNKRRQAFTGSLGSQPGAEAAPPPAGDQTLQRLTDKAMAARIQ